MRSIQFGIYANVKDFIPLCASLDRWNGKMRFDEVRKVYHIESRGLKGDYFKGTDLDPYPDIYIIKFHMMEDDFEAFCEENGIDENRQWW